MPDEPMPQNSPDGIRLRPHHAFCEAFSPWSIPERGEAFNSLEQQIRQELKSGSDTLIEVISGVDDLCQKCQFCQDGRCQSPEGDEDKVRRWDDIVLKGMEISYGARLTARELSRLTGQKAPLTFCRTRCKMRNGCSSLSVK